MEKMKQRKGNTVKYFLKEKIKLKKNRDQTKEKFFYGNERKP
jgi:hypothetical protein